MVMTTAETGHFHQLPEQYRFALVDANGEPTEQCRNHLRAISMGFHYAAPDEDGYAQYAKDSTGARLREVREVEPSGELPGLPIATLTGYDQTVNTGHGHLESAEFITDVTVRATHRRRGLLRSLMTYELDQARQAGKTFAALTATEGSIYGRYGFGIATQAMSVEVTKGRNFSLPHEPAGTIEIVYPGAIDDVREAVFADFHASHRGSHGRQRLQLNYAAGRCTADHLSTPNPRMRSAVHRDDSGRPDGVVSYEVTEDFGKLLKVHDFVTVNPDAELALWKFLTSVDLVTKVEAPIVGRSTPLQWAIKDPYQMRITGMKNFTWLRVLDVQRALEVRGWDHAGTVQFRIEDPLGWCDGTWQVEVSEPGAQAVVTRIDDRDDVASFGIRALGSMYFGLAHAHSLAAAGRMNCTPEQLLELDRFFDTFDQAYNITGF